MVIMPMSWLAPRQCEGGVPVLARVAAIFFADVTGLAYTRDGPALAIQQQFAGRAKSSPIRTSKVTVYRVALGPMVRWAEWMKSGSGSCSADGAWIKAGL